MKLNLYCVECQMKRHFEKARSISDASMQLDYITEVMGIIASGKALPSPVISSLCAPAEAKYLGANVRYSEIKKRYNDIMLGLEEKIEQRISGSEDQLRTALLFSRAGNYIDFGTEKPFSEDRLFELLDGAEREPLDEKTYSAFVRDMDKAKSFTIITDNCGEIVLDKLLMRRITERWPELSVTVLVRGGETLNDATRVDAEQVGLTGSYRIADTGSAIPGLWPERAGAQALELLEGSDVILSKGQANCECLGGCGRNIYYLLLCKCERFIELFDVPRLTGIFIGEQDIERLIAENEQNGY